MPEHRRRLADGRVVVVVPQDGSWLCFFEDDPDDCIVGYPLNSTIAELLGYRVAHESWPSWIDRWATEIGGS